MSQEKDHIIDLPGGPVRFDEPDGTWGPQRAVFVSHTAADAEFVKETISEIVHDGGLLCQYLNYTMTISEPYKKKILEIMTTCQWILVVLSPQSLRSEWVKFECDWAIEHKHPSHILPILKEECKFSDLNIHLESIPIIDFVHDESLARLDLIRRLKTDALSKDELKGTNFS